VSIKKTVRIPQAELPNQNEITSVKFVDLGDSVTPIAKQIYFSQEIPGADFVNENYYPGAVTISPTATISERTTSVDAYGKYYGKLVLNFTEGLSVGQEIYIGDPAVSYIPLVIEQILTPTSIKVWSNVQLTNGTTIKITANGMYYFKLITQEAHNFVVGDKVYINGIGKYFDGTTKITKVFEKEIHYYNKSIDPYIGATFNISRIGFPTNILSQTLNSSGFIKRVYDYYSNDFTNPLNYLGLTQISAIVSAITIKSGIATVTTYVNHNFLVGDSFGLSGVSYLGKLYIRNSEDANLNTQLYVVTKILSPTSFEFLIGDTTVTSTTSLSQISTSGTIGSVVFDAGTNTYTARISGLSTPISQNAIVQYSVYDSLIATNGTGSLGNVISTTGIVGDAYDIGGGVYVRNITGMTSTTGLVANVSSIVAGESVGKIIPSAVHSIINATSIRIFDDGIPPTQPSSNKSGKIVNILNTSTGYYITAVGSNYVDIYGSGFIVAGTISNIHINTGAFLTPDNLLQYVIRYQTKNPHGLRIGSNVSVFNVIPGTFNVNNYKLYYEPEEKTFDISYISPTTITRLSPYLNLPSNYGYRSFPSFGEVPYTVNMENKTYKSGGFINTLIYYLRYRLTSSDKNKVSEWSPVIKTDNTYYEPIKDIRFDGGEQNW
jgi:hypothetical protein